MSIKVMSLVWEDDTLDPSEKLVLLALADHADDDGACYPSILRLVVRTGLSERGVQKVLTRLTGAGYVVIEKNAGRSGTNRYTVRPRTTFTPEPRSPRTTFTTPPNHVRKTPEPRSPKPSITINEPSKDIRPADEVRAILVEFASHEAVTSFLSYRRKRKGGALTVTAAQRLAKQLKAILDAGGDPSDALGLAEERGWQTVTADWYLADKRKQGLGRSEPRNGKPSGPTRLAAFMAGASETPRVDSGPDRDPSRPLLAGR